MMARGLGAVGLRRFMARVGSALDGVELSPLERQGSIPMDAATLGSLASRVAYWRERAEQAEDGYSAANERNHALIAENQQLSNALLEAQGIPLAEFTGDARDDGVPEVHQAVTLDPLASAEARLRALEAPETAAGVLPRCGAERGGHACEKPEGHDGSHWAGGLDEAEFEWADPCETCNDSGEVRRLASPPDPQTEESMSCPDCLGGSN